MKKTIFAIDDNENILKLIEVSLGNEFDFFPFTTPEEALLHLPRNKPDLIISDIMLPGMNGYEFCSHLQGHEQWRQIPFILLSSKAGSNARATGYKLGAVSYIEKPFDPVELLSIVKSLIRHDEFSKPSSALQTRLEKKGITLEVVNNELLFEGNKVSFTQAETLLFYELLKNFGLACSRDQLKESIDSSSATDRVLDTHFRSIRLKIENIPFEISTIYGKGYKLVAKE